MFIRNPGYVLKSTTPAEHRVIVDANEANRAQAVENMESFCAGFADGGEPWAHQTDSGAVALTGVLVESRIEPPVGMRYDTKAKGGRLILVPAKKTEQGKAIAKIMSGLRHIPASLGEVSKVLIISNGTSQWFASAVIEALGDDVYATYHHPLENTQHMGRPSDRERVEADAGWTPIPLSEFHAAREQYAPDKVAV